MIPTNEKLIGKKRTCAKLRDKIAHNQTDRQTDAYIQTDMAKRHADRLYTYICIYIFFPTFPSRYNKFRGQLKIRC